MSLLLSICLVLFLWHFCLPRTSFVPIGQKLEINFACKFSFTNNDSIILPTCKGTSISGVSEVGDRSRHLASKMCWNKFEGVSTRYQLENHEPVMVGHAHTRTVRHAHTHIVLGPTTGALSLRVICRNCEIKASHRT